jgi:thioredoxin reductase (NADPH)
MNQKIYDVIIIGAGPAGLTAGIYTSRFGLKTLVLEGRLLGGRAQEATKVENFPGFPNGITGSELVQKIIEQTKNFGTELKMAEVVKLDTTKGIKTASTKKNGLYQARTIIIATGTQRKKLLVPGETEFLGQGVSYCSVCDGNFFKNLNVTVVGSNDEAANEAFFLTNVARNVTMISSKEKVEMSETWRKRLEKENFKLLLNTKVVEIVGENFVKAIRVVNLKTNEEQKIETDGVFISLGRIPMTEIMKNAGIEIDQRGCIKADRQQRTSVQGVFAAGDCTCGGMQIITAAGEGAAAAIRASLYVRNSERSHA